MTTMNEVIDVLSVGLCVDEASVAWMALKLQDPDLLPADDGEVTPLHVSRLLVALLAAGRPIDAAAAVIAYERAPALHLIRTDGRRELDRTAIEDMPIPEGNGPAFAALSRCFVSAVAWIIASAATDPTTPLPAQISARRSLDVPLGVLLDVPKPGGPGKTMTFVYGHASENGEAMGGGALEVYAAAPGAVLQELADLLLPQGEQTWERAMPEQPRSAQLRRPSLADCRKASRQAAGR